MDKIKKYQDIITQYLEEYAAIPYSKSPGIEKQVIADRQRNHFQLVSIGWDKSSFEHATILHFDIKDGKVWIQQNWTELPVADDLIERGVDKSDIVLGFLPDFARPLSGFAAA